MSLIPLRPILEATQKHAYAQGAFNVNAVAQAKAAIEVHEMFRSPAILQGADLANAFMGGRTDFLNGTVEDKQKGARNIGDAVRKYGENSSIPVVLHLDHGKDFDSVKAAIAGGYTSVMIDGSSLPFNENIELTREVVRYAHERGVSVEGELGVLAGVEDHVFSEKSTYTNPMDAVEFFKKTGVDCLAISYGTMHGASKGKDVRLRKEIAIAVKECLLHENIFGVLVSHGSSTVPQYIVEEINALGGKLVNTYGIALDQLKAVIPCGIGKINVDTDIRLAVTRNMKELFSANPDLQKSEAIGAVYNLLQAKQEQFDPRAFLPPIAVEYNKKLAQLENPTAQAHEELTNYQQVLSTDYRGTIGYIVIDKIDLTLPIYHGTTETVISIAVGHMEGTSFPIGENGSHAMLTTHTGLPRAKLFTDIDTLEIGDVFSVTVLDDIAYYEVDKIKVVLPNDIDPELTINENEDRITLMTCTPYGVNTHRLLVQAIRTETTINNVQNTPNSLTMETTQPPIVLTFEIIFSIAIIILFIIIAILSFIGYNHLKHNQKKATKKYIHTKNIYIKSGTTNEKK